MVKSPLFACITLLIFLACIFIYRPSSFPFSPTSRAARSPPELGCDIFKGRWLPSPPQQPPTIYTNRSCGTLPSARNCLLHGRPDDEFLRWRWVPYGCRIPRFDAAAFLGVVAGKTAAFVGDSVARNQVDSLICMLSTAERPVDVFKDAKDRSRTWYFPSHNFTLMVLWTKFLVKHKERGINGYPTGIFDLHLDQVDEIWSNRFELHQQPIHFIVISDSRWFFRQNFLYESDRLVGCTYCNDTTTKDLGPTFAIRRALSTSLGHIITAHANKSAPFWKDVVILARTVSPSHFEGGTWKEGGRCDRKRPFEEESIEELTRTGNGAVEWEVGRAQVEEVERAKVEGKKLGLVVEALDVTRAMLMRPDGHPGRFWRDKKKNGYNDCVHWCLPGPIDVWNELLFATLRRLSS